MPNYPSGFVDPHTGQQRYGLTRSVLMVRLFRSCGFILAGTILLACVSSADSLFVGFNTQTPIQVYTKSGTYLQDIGPAGAIAVIPTSSEYFFITPSSSFTSTTIGAYNPNVV